jgi:RNA polymerase sigma-70 factor (ECF subfamily)
MNAGQPPLELDSDQLMRATKAGDRRAFDQLVSQLRTRAFHVAYGLVASRDDALDLTQEAFLKIYRARASFDEGQPFLPWFHRILKNTCISYLRKRRGLKPISLDQESEDDTPALDPASDAAPVGTELVQGEVQQGFHTAFAQLSAADREVLALRHFDDLSYTQIAAALGVPEGTVMSRLFHARRRLRDRLRPLLVSLAIEDLDEGSVTSPRFPRLAKNRR